MPGLSVGRGGPSDVVADFAHALATTEFLDDYDARTALERDGVVVGETTYDGYPTARFETDHGTAFLEGLLYGADDVEAQVERAAALVAAGHTDALREWIRGRDGDFLLALVDGDSVAIVNDAFGRLPTYHATVDGAVVASRELGFVRAFARRRGEPLELDRLAVAQQLCLGYPLGTRTTFEGVRTVPPGSLVRIDDGVAIESVYDHDFDRCRHADRSVEANAGELADRIASACEARAVPDRSTVVSLSGGLDSRTLAAAFVAAGLPASAATFQRPGGGNADEVGTAGTVAECLGLDWTVYAVEQSEERREALLDAKQGMNYLGMGYVLDFFEQLRRDHDAPVYVTGDGGDKVLVDLEPAARPGSPSALVDHVIEANSRMSPADAAAVAGIDRARLRSSVDRRLRSYPESDPARRYVHFLVRERGINYLLHGEDRNRYYVWSVAPFYALPVFEYAMNCPDDQKRYRALHAAVLDRLEPALADVTYPNYDAPITSREYRIKQFAYDVLERYPGLRQRLVDVVTGDAGDTSEVADAIRRQLPDLGEAPLSLPAVADVVRDHGAYSEVQLELLYTVTSLAADVERERSAGAPADRGGDRVRQRDPHSTDGESGATTDD